MTRTAGSLSAQSEAEAHRERGFESLIFNSRWLMAPFYFGLVVSLAVLLLKFCMVLWEFILHAPGSKESDIILGVLGLIDISLTGNLILIVVFSGYENFVSKIDPGSHPDWPDWMTKVNFGGLKQKLLASIVAISAIQVLKAFMNIDSDVRSQQARLAGRRASGVRGLGLHAGDVRPLERRRPWRRVAIEPPFATRHSLSPLSRTLRNSFASGSSTNSEPSATPK